MKYWLVIYLILSSSIISLTGNETHAEDIFSEIKPPIFEITKDTESENLLHSIPHYSPFFLVDHGAVLNYSPVVLIPNPDWYANNSLDYFSETYVPGIKINETIVDLSSYDHEDLLAVGVDWDVASYGMHSFHSLNYSVYADNGTLLASDVIDVEIQLEEQPPIDYINSKIEIGLLDFYHNTYPSDLQYAIYPDGLVLYSRFGPDDVTVYEGWLADDRYNELLDIIWSYEFFNFKNYYFGPADSIHFDVDYYTEVELGNTSYHKFFTGYTSPLLVIELWNFLASEVSELNYIPREGFRLFGVSGFWGLTWKWWFTIFGSTAGLLVLGFVFKRFRR